MSDLPKLNRIDPARLKLRELADVERVLGRKLAAEFMTGDLGIDTMQALVWLELRRQDPQATFEQAGEYDMEALTAAFADDDEGTPDPTSAPAGANNASVNGASSSRPTQPSTTSGG